MVAAGTGANVGLELFVVGNGRWEAQNFPNAEVPTSQIVWDWSDGLSNFTTLEQAELATNGGRTWVTETSTDLATTLFTGLAMGPSGVDGGGAVFSSSSDADEIAKAFPGQAAVTVTRMFAQLPYAALSSDLQLQSSLGAPIPQRRTAAKGVNFYCPTVTYVNCGSGTCGGDPDGGGASSDSGPSASGSSSSSGGSCTVSAAPSRTTIGWLAIVAGLAIGARVLRRLALRR
jgi:hypothetical protein